MSLNTYKYTFEYLIVNVYKSINKGAIMYYCPYCGFNAVNTIDVLFDIGVITLYCPKCKNVVFYGQEGELLEFGPNIATPLSMILMRTAREVKQYFNVS